MEAVNPATGESLQTYEKDGASDVRRAIEAADETFEEWREVPLRERERLLAAAAEVLRDRAREYGALITREMGKPIDQAVAEVEKCAQGCDHYAEHASAYLGEDHHAAPPGVDVRTRYEPLGPVLAVMPWNFPFWQVFRFAAPYLTAGNVGLLKHSSIVPGCARAIEDVFREAGYPEDVFQSLLIDSELVEDVLRDERVRAATLTGSGGAGRSVAETAGSELKKTVLELGGSDPFVVLDDAAVEEAAETGAWARNQNAGQSCIAGKRFLVHEDVYTEFLEAFAEEIDDYTVGDPSEEGTDVGPLASEEFVEGLHEQVQESVDAGAELILGGEPIEGEGAFYEPTVLAEVPEGCPADADETFGPVAAVYEVPDEAAAIEKANDTSFGLGASIWTEDRERGRRVAAEIEAGCVYVNELVKSDPRVPFGGVKESGYGRELSEAGIKEFVNRKTVWVQ